MAQYSQPFSFEVKITDAEQRSFITRRLGSIEDLDEEEREELFDADEDVESILENGGYAACSVEPQTDSLILWADDGDLERVANTLSVWQTRYNIDLPVAFEWAETCSKPRPGEFGGGACAIYHGEQHWKSTKTWAEEKIAELTTPVVEP